MFTNHWWNGADPILIISDTTVIKAKGNKIYFINLNDMQEKISREEEIDWIIKYFILLSVKDFFSIENVFIMQQKESVLISKATQIEIHEFIKKHKIDDISRNINTKGEIVILSKFKLQI